MSAVPAGISHTRCIQMKTKIIRGKNKTSIPDPRGAASVERVAGDIIAQLRRMGDPVRARGAQNYFKYEIVALGITAPVMRAFVRERVQVLRPQWTASQAIALCSRLLSEPEMDIRGAGFLVLSGFKKELTPDLLDQAEAWVTRRLDNWALVDGFCSAVLSPLLERFPSAEKRLEAWARAESLWLRRAAIVTLVPFARRGRLLDTVYRLARAHFGDPEDLMHKATGWLLREAGKTDMPRLRRYLLEHGRMIPRTALRYAIERFPRPEREFLLGATRVRSETP
jgi:3-methyladenine DNA glycosylase AlkD